jgi:IclR family KDG regulon transcriptional repressor
MDEVGMAQTTPPQPEIHDGERYRVRAVHRALDLLDCFTVTKPELTLLELAEQTGLSTSTAYRLMQTLEGRAFVEHRPETGRYRLGMSCLRLGGNVMAQLDLRERLRPLLTELRDEYGETVHMAILDRNRMEVIYLDKLDGWLPIGMMSSRVGSHSPAYCTGVGKVLLAGVDPATIRAFYGEQGLCRYTANTITDVEVLLAALDSVRCQGYALDNVEHEPDVKCVAVPIFDYTGQTTSSVSMSGPEARMNLHICQEGLVERMLELADDASAQLGYTRGLAWAPLVEAQRRDTRASLARVDAVPSTGEPAEG